MMPNAGVDAAELLDTLSREGEVVITVGLVAWRISTTLSPPYAKVDWFWPHRKVAELRPAYWQPPDKIEGLTPDTCAGLAVLAVLDGRCHRMRA